MKDLSFKVDKSHLTWNKYLFNFAKNTKEQVNKITESIEDYKEIIFVVPNIHPYRFSIQAFMKYFNLDKVFVLFENVLNSGKLIKKIEDKKYVEKKYDEIPVKKEFILKTVDRLVFNFFKQKTPLKRNVKLSTLFLDGLFKNKKSKNILKGKSDKGEIFFYKCFDTKNPFNIKNKYIFMDILFNDVYADPNAFNHIFEYYGNRKFGISEYNNGYFLSKNDVVFFEFEEYSKPKLEEGFTYAVDYFTYDELGYELSNEIFEYSVISDDLEVLDYESIPLNLNVENYIKEIIRKDNDSEIVKELNLLCERFQNLFDYGRYKPVIKCPECIDGRIYENDYVYFCDKCDFKFFKNNKTFGIFNKRLFTLLMKYKTIELFYKGEIRKVRISKGKGGWYNVRLVDGH
jgi:hypothetical protein